MKKILKVIIILLIMIASLNFVYVSYEERTLNSEMKNLAKKDVKKDIYTLNIVSNNKYARVECAVKEYLIDYSKEVKKATEIVGNNRLNSILSSDNYQKDGKEFKETLKYLEDYKKSVEEVKTNLNKLASKKETNKYINKQHVSTYYKNLYSKYMTNSQLANNIKNTNEELLDATSNIEELINKELEVIKFLSTNTDWVISNNEIMFLKNEDLAKYNELIKDIS